jgi:hypothetical protein
MNLIKADTNDSSEFYGERGTMSLFGNWVMIMAG